MSLQSTDPIADMLTRIRNAIAVGKNEITLPYSSMKERVASELKSAGYLNAVAVEKAEPRNNLVVTINELGSNAVITAIDRLSRPGRRVYASAADIPRIKSGRGVVIVSTSKGVMTGSKAIKERLGGELICKVY